MRPVLKSIWPITNGVRKSYNPHTIAKPDLEDDLGNYCSYCEIFSADLQVEHVISQHQDATLKNDWENFLVGCPRCNGKDNKSNKNVDRNLLHFPHERNTMLSFTYLEGGAIVINPSLTGDAIIHATNMLDLVCIDKAPGNPRYPGHKPNDTRWKHRKTAWDQAERKLVNLQAGQLTEDQIVDFAKAHGFFSVWFQIFSDYPLVRALLIQQFKGTAATCFHAGTFDPIPRNPGNVTDPT